MASAVWLLAFVLSPCFLGTLQERMIWRMLLAVFLLNRFIVKPKKEICIPFYTRFWSSTAVLPCALLAQSC